LVIKLRQVQKKKLEEELNIFFEILWKFYSYEIKRWNRAKAFAVAYAKALKMAEIKNVKVIITDLSDGESIRDVNDITMLKSFTKFTVNMKLGLLKVKKAKVLIDDEKNLIKILTF